MQAITTKYLPATNTKPSRMKAECAAGSLTLSFSVCDEPTLPGKSPHERCAYALFRKLGWDSQFELASGMTKDGIGVHVLMPAKAAHAAGWRRCADVHIEEANARLIAAAPDLLTALRAVLNQSWDGPLPDFIREKACDALAKAEGQE